jgi:hypothetical protein
MWRFACSKCNPITGNPPLLLRVLSFWDKSKHRKKTNTGFTAPYTGLPTAAEIVLQGFIIQTKIVCMEQPLDFLQILQCRQNDLQEEQPGGSLCIGVCADSGYTRFFLYNNSSLIKFGTRRKFYMGIYLFHWTQYFSF